MTQDAVTIAPHAYKVVLENDRVRVLEFRAKPGDKTAMHTHPNAVAVSLTDASYRFIAPDGQSSDAKLTAGQVLFQEAIEHATEIIGTTEARALIIELK